MATVNHLRDRISSLTPSTNAISSALLARALLVALLFSHLSTISASPLPSIPASSPGFASATSPDIYDHVADVPGHVTSGIDPAAAEAAATASKSTSETDPYKGDQDDHWPLQHEDLAGSDERMGVDAMGNAIEKGVSTDASISPPPSPSHPSDSDPIDFGGGPLGLVVSIFLGFWNHLLGSFLVFWLLIASTVGSLVLVGWKLRSLERSGALRRWGRKDVYVEMEQMEEGVGQEEEKEEEGEQEEEDEEEEEVEEGGGNEEEFTNARWNRNRSTKRSGRRKAQGMGMGRAWRRGVRWGNSPLED